MPNGGSDNCGTCWFNYVNDGKTANQLPEAKQDASESAQCTIRGMEVPRPYWAYCANHQYHNPDRVETPVGPVYTCYIHYHPRIVMLPSPDTPEIRSALVKLLESMAEVPREDSPTATRFDDEVIKQLMQFRETGAIEGLHRVARFDPVPPAGEGARFPRDRVSTVAWAIQALGVIAGDDALAQLEAGLKAGFEQGRTSERARELVEIRRRAVLGLAHCESPYAARLLRLAALDPEAEVSTMATEAWFVSSRGERSGTWLTD